MEVMKESLEDKLMKHLEILQGLPLGNIKAVMNRHGIEFKKQTRKGILWQQVYLQIIKNKLNISKILVL
jgi:hypothetical protein